MKSYAAIDRIEEKFAVCEVELVPVEESPNLSVSEKETEMIDVQLNRVTQLCGDVEEGDIIVVEHDRTNVIDVYGKDELEKQRRIKLLEEIMKS